MIDVIETAKKEYAEELFREQVEAHKEKLRNQATLWDRVFPFKILIIRKDK